jgi:uncharacterized protein YndB with AHSA1/START domain
MNEVQEKSTVIVERTFRHPVEKVWRALTDSSLLAQWMMPNDFAAEVGRQFKLRAEPMPQWDGIVEGEVLEVEPQRRLRYVWTSPASIEVDLTLTPLDDGVHLKVQLSGAEKPAVGGARYGWEQQFLPALEQVLEPSA